MYIEESYARRRIDKEPATLCMQGYATANVYGNRLLTPQKLCRLEIFNSRLVAVLALSALGIVNIAIAPHSQYRQECTGRR